MRKILEYVHHPNQTEIGVGTNTHDAYLKLSQAVEDTEMFVDGKDEEFDHVASHSRVVLKAIKYKTGSKEFRLTKFGAVRAQLQIECGDELVFRREIGEHSGNPTIEVHHFSKVMLYPFSSEEYMVVYPHRIPGWNVKGVSYLQVRYKGGSRQLKFEFVGMKKKRKDSPNTTAVYKVYLGTMLLSKDDYCISFKDDIPECYACEKCAYNEMLLNF